MRRRCVRWVTFITFRALPVLWLVGVPVGVAEGATARQPVVVNGDRVEYQTDQQRVVGLGHVVVTYGDVILTCDRIVVFTETRDAYAGVSDLRRNALRLSGLMAERGLAKVAPIYSTFLAFFCLAAAGFFFWAGIIETIKNFLPAPVSKPASSS